MLDLLDTEKHFILSHLVRGCTAVDFTMGNGNDTLFLSRSVGPEGKVYAFDIQEKALASTERLLSEHNAPRNYTLIKDSHHRAKDYIKEGSFRVGMFNLGYLPGSDKSVTTLHETTLEAVKAASLLLEHSGCITVAVYPGHEEGAVEGRMLEEMLSSYDRKSFCITGLRIVNSASSPFIFLIEKK